MDIKVYRKLHSDLKAGFVVSLVALPISIACPLLLALSHCWINRSVVEDPRRTPWRSYVTITGPGNGLAVVTLMAITSFGENGFYMALGAIVTSGCSFLARSD